MMMHNVVKLPRKMSANVMASISRTLASRESKTPPVNEIRFAGDERKDKLYEPKHRQKLVRVLTVIAYIIFVSMAAILLSLYYTFIWDPKNYKESSSLSSTKLDNRNEKSNCDCELCFKILNSTILPIPNETQIEKMTARSITTGNKDLEELVLSTTQQQKSLWEILTKTVDIKQTTIEFTSTSTSQIDYHNLTNNTNEDVT